ncbi:TauD/TfdA family dioxygenase [Yoonia sp. SS1-5]|uniref:TauD/TfdA family dioxygenase n=1 Tax=Yoonia rhodophyticola TaxID=3137370 RepID=A0AAN0NM98_9RHOB
MKDAAELPITPDFDTWPVTHDAVSVAPERGALRITWSDDQVSLHHPLLLAENDPSPRVLHPLSRETVLNPVDFAPDLQVAAAKILPNGAICVRWSHGDTTSTFHPGWLRGHAYFGEMPETPKPILWTAEEQPGPPTFHGPAALDDPKVMLAWLCALRDYGVARLENLPDQDGLLVEIAQRIGTIRGTNFGPTYTLEIKDDPDSNAYTANSLPQHIDLPTRECPPGLQFLYCRTNTTTGGEGLYVDAYRVAKDMRREEPAHFRALCEIPWTYNNRAKTNSYKASGPVVELDADDQITSVRYNTWLRSPFVGPIEEQDRAYRAYRAFAARAQHDRYLMKIVYRRGDLLGFDNRRALHGRNGYDAKGGSRYIEGLYSDRDDLYSAIRTLQRQIG